jgi:Rrf2 family protein
MRFTRAITYTVHALVFMASRAGNPTLASHEVAEVAGLPERFLLKVLKRLVTAGILQSVRGPGGGFRLARAPRRISLLEVVEAVEGPVGRPIPLTGRQSDLDRRLQAISDRAAEVVRRELRRVSVAALAAGRGPGGVDSGGTP